ncbi:MAG: exopolyphosphatase [Flavobacteriaceae bacterium]
MKIDKYAAIDIGSNAVRMLIANVIQDKGETYFRKNSLVRVPIRLGEDSFTSGTISTTNRNRLIESIKAFKILMEVHGVKHYLAYATSALREADNGQEVLDEIASQSEIKIELIDGAKEAAILSNTNIFDQVSIDKTFLYIDVGGGSTEFSVIKKGERICSKSFKIGTVRLLNGQVPIHYWDEIEDWIITNLSTVDKVYLLGTGGNINKLHKMAALKEEKPITYLMLNALYRKISALTYEERIVHLGLNPDRSDVILPAMEIYIRALRWSRAKVIYVPKIGLSDGMIKEIAKMKGLSI